MAEPIPLTTPRLLFCVSHHEMGMVRKSSAIFNRDRAIAVQMLGVSCLIMFVVKIMSWGRSAGNTGFVMAMELVSSPSMTAASLSTSISTPSVSLVAQCVWANAMLTSAHSVSMLVVHAWPRFSILKNFVEGLVV